MRIPILLQKISALAGQPESHTIIDVDLMLDYTRVLYADLLERRAKLTVIAQRIGMPAINEPTLAELAEAMDEELAKARDEELAEAMYQEPAEARGEKLAEAMDEELTRARGERLAEARDDEPAEATDEEKEDDRVEIADQLQLEFTAIPQNIQQPPAIQPQTTKPKLQTPEAKDIRSLISINDKYQILSELFGNDMAAYEDALNHINEAVNEAVAVRWLQERLWIKEENSDAALGFYDLVSRFKRQGTGFTGMNRDLQD